MCIRDSSVTLPAGTKLQYTITDENSTYDKVFSLTLDNEQTFVSDQSISNISVTASEISSDLDLTKVETGIQSTYSIPVISKTVIEDDDTAGLIFSEKFGSEALSGNSRTELKEGGESVKRYVSLKSQPLNAVTLTLETDDKSEILLQKDESEVSSQSSYISFNFNPETWSTPQSFNIIPVDDNLVDGDINADIYSHTTSSDPTYQERYDYQIDKISSLGFSVKDNDQPSVSIELQQGKINESSNGFINFNLSAKPTSDVLINLVPSDHQFTINNRSIGRGESITFTPDDWQSIQTVQIKAVDDSAIEDITSSDLNISISSNDANFNGLEVNPITVDIVDNDLPTATIVPYRDGTEEAQPGLFQIQLDSPANISEGSKGILVDYKVTAINIDSEGLGYPSEVESSKYVTQNLGEIKGQVRIAPGQSSSDVFIVPIDDYYADAFDKEITISLLGSENEDYQINAQENNSATIKIINNDIEGMTLLLSGEKLRVSENGGNGEFQLVLNSQPGSDVEINITEENKNGSQLGDGSSPFSLTKTFTPTNWFIPQVISVSSFDDFEIEDGTGENLLTGIHPTQLKYQFKSDDQKYNSDKEKSSDHFTNFTQDVEVVDYKLPEETADSLTSSLTSLQEGIDSLSLPIVGNLNGKTGGGLRKFITNLSNKIKEIVMPTPSKLEALIDTEIEAALGNDKTVVTLAMTTVDDNDNHAIDVGFTFEDAYLSLIHI